MNLPATTARSLPDAELIAKVVIHGDLSALDPAQKLDYYGKVCQSVGLNPLTRPFEYMRLSGKEVLYAKRDATDQLRRIYEISAKITSRETSPEGIHTVTVFVSDKTGRTDESTGSVNIKGFSGDALANAFMKAETKAKRRATLSICGLGMLDESEVETIPGAVKVPPPKPAVPAKQEPQEIKPLADPGEFFATSGSNKGKKLKDIPYEDLLDVVDFLTKEKAAKEKTGGKLVDYLALYLANAEAFLVETTAKEALKAQ